MFPFKLIKFIGSYLCALRPVEGTDSKQCWAGCIESLLIVDPVLNCIWSGCESAY